MSIDNQRSAEIKPKAMVVQYRIFYLFEFPFESFFQSWMKLEENLHNRNQREFFETEQ